MVDSGGHQVTTFLRRLLEASDEPEEASGHRWSASKVVSKRNERNGTEWNGRRRLYLRMRGHVGRTERAGTEWNSTPMFRKHQLSTSASVRPPPISNRASPAVRPLS